MPKLTYLGHSAFLMEGKSTRLLLDPFLTGNPTFPEDYDVGDIDYILLTHGHGDHVGDTIDLAKKYDAAVVGIYDLTAWLASKGVEKTEGMNKGGTIQLNDELSVTLTHAFHSSTYEENGQLIPLGEACGMIIHLDDTVIYAAGDTDIFSDMALIQKLYKPTIGLIPIGDRFTMNPTTAAYACNEFLDLKTIIPIHHSTFPLLTGTPAEFEKQVKKGKVVTLEPGESL